MIYFITLVIGLLFGLIIKDRIPKFIDKYIITKKHKYKIKFNAYFIIHRYESNTNEMIKTESIEISILAKDEDEATTLTKELIENDIRVEIEDIELVQ